MTVDRESVLQAIRELYAEEDRWLFAKDVAVRMGLKGSGPIARVVRKELEAMAKDGVIDTEAESGFGRRFKAREGPPAEAVEEQEDEPEGEDPEEEEGEDEPGQGADRPRLVRRSLPTATHRVLKVLSDGAPRKLKVLCGYGVSTTTLKPMREEGLVVSGPDGYRITDAGLRGLSEIEEDWPQLRGAEYACEERAEAEAQRPKGRMPTTVHAMLCALADGRPRRAKDLMAVGIGEKTHGTVYQHGWCERTTLGYAITDAGRARMEEIERDWPELRGKGRDFAFIVPAQEPQPSEPQPIETEAVVEAEVQEPVPVPEPESKSESESEPEDVMNPMSKLSDAGIPEDEEPDDPPIGEAVNAVVLEVAVVYRIELRTARGPTTVEVRKEDLRDVLGPLGTYGAEGRAVRLREREGRTQVGHIVDDAWRWAL